MDQKTLIRLAKSHGTPIVVVDHKVLEISKPYLGKFLSVASDWNPLRHYSNYFRGYNQPQLDTSDPWQFKNFLITDGD